MSDLVQMVEESATRLFGSFVETQATELMEAGDFPQAIWDDFVADGWLKTMLPEEKEGTGLGLEGGYLLMRLAGYYATPLPITESLMAFYLAAEAGIDLPNGVFVPVFLTEDTTQSSTLTIKNIPWARHAEGLIIIRPAQTGLAVSLVAKGLYNCQPGHNMAGEPRDEVSLDPSHLQQSSPLTGVDMAKLESWMALARASQMAGALKSVLERTVEYANERSQFGRQIGKFQAVQQQLAVQAELTSASICAVDAAIQHLSTEQELELIACAKITTGESAGYAAKTSHAVHAAIGFTQEYPLQLSTRRLWSWRDEFGNEANWSARLGQQCIDLTTDGLWSWLTTQTS
ncbi:MAG: acyl-CoA dehydrogenase [Cycloclasticus sp.]|nr:acyl-CoA dehydrogenase [Cycloclasticus sp.]